MLKRGRITAEQAEAAVVAFESIAVTLAEVDLQRAVKIAGQLQIYAYDAYVIVAALDLNCPLLTLDAGLAHAAKVVGVKVLEV